MPTAAPALKIPPMAAQLLKNIDTITNKERFSFFIWFFLIYDANMTMHLLFLTISAFVIHIFSNTDATLIEINKSLVRMRCFF